MAASVDELMMLQLLKSGQYERAMGVGVHATMNEINRAHIRLLHRFKGHAELTLTLNRVKGILADESSVQKARRLLNLGQPEDAVAVLRQAIPRDNSVNACHLIGVTLFQLNRYQEALVYLKMAADRRGTPSDSIWLGNALERLHRYQEALACYEEAIRKRGDEMEHRFAGNMHFQMDNLESARTLYLRARELGCRNMEMDRRLRTLQAGRFRQKIVPGVSKTVYEHFQRLWEGICKKKRVSKKNQ